MTRTVIRCRLFLLLFLSSGLLVLLYRGWLWPWLALERQAVNLNVVVLSGHHFLLRINGGVIEHIEVARLAGQLHPQFIVLRALSIFRNFSQPLASELFGLFRRLLLGTVLRDVPARSKPGCWSHRLLGEVGSLRAVHGEQFLFLCVSWGSFALFDVRNVEILLHDVAVALLILQRLADGLQVSRVEASLLHRCLLQLHSLDLFAAPLALAPLHHLALHFALLFRLLNVDLLDFEFDAA